MNPLSLPPLPPAELQPALGSSVRASRAASARRAHGRMRGRLRRRASSAYEPPLPATAAAGRAAAGAWRQREGFTGCQRSPRMRGTLRRRAGRAMNPLFLPRLPPAVPQTEPGSSVRASRAASARPTHGHMRRRLQRRAGRTYEPPLPSTAAAGSAAAGAWQQREGFTGCQRSPRTRPHARQAAEEGKQCL